MNDLKKSITKLKKEVWTELSMYIRQKYADARGFVSCVTCGVRKKWNNGMQAGHFVSGRHNSLIFDERNIHPQCMMCNYNNQGEQYKYGLFMLKTYGQKVIDELFKLDRILKSFRPQELIDLKNHFRALNKKNPLNKADS